MKRKAAETELRQSKYLNNVIEQDHRNESANCETDDGKQERSIRHGRSLSGIEAISMIRKGQANRIERGDSASQVKFIEELFGISA